MDKWIEYVGSLLPDARKYTKTHWTTDSMRMKQSGIRIVRSTRAQMRVNNNKKAGKNYVLISHQTHDKLAKLLETFTVTTKASV